jgi:hypothetical protein
VSQYFILPLVTQLEWYPRPSEFQIVTLTTELVEWLCHAVRDISNKRCWPRVRQVLCAPYARLHYREHQAQTDSNGI